MRELRAGVMSGMRAKFRIGTVGYQFNSVGEDASVNNGSIQVASNNGTRRPFVAVAFKCGLIVTPLGHGRPRGNAAGGPGMEQSLGFTRPSAAGRGLPRLLAQRRERPLDVANCQNSQRRFQ